jgi:hypothetical protein
MSVFTVKIMGCFVISMIFLMMRGRWAWIHPYSQALCFVSEECPTAVGHWFSSLMSLKCSEILQDMCRPFWQNSILSDSQAAVKVSDKKRINSALALDFHQTPMKLNT